PRNFHPFPLPGSSIERIKAQVRLSDKQIACYEIAGPLPESPGLRSSREADLNEMPKLLSPNASLPRVAKTSLVDEVIAAMRGMLGKEAWAPGSKLPSEQELSR